MRLIVKSRRLAEQSNSVKAPHVIISIRNPGSRVPDLAMNGSTKKVVYLEFDDIDRMPEKGSSTYIALGKPIMFDSDMARKILTAIQGEEVQTVIVHCEAGISRSAGVAAALSKYYNGDDSEFFSSCINPYSYNTYYPNRHVRRVMLNTIHEVNNGN